MRTSDVASAISKEDKCSTSDSLRVAADVVGRKLEYKYKRCDIGGHLWYEQQLVNIQEGMKRWSGSGGSIRYSIQTGNQRCWSGEASIK